MLTLMQVFWSFSLMGASLPLPEYTDYGPNTLAIGGMSAAAANGNDSILTNPVGMMYLKGKSSIAGNWQTLGNDQSQWSVSVVDGTNEVVGGFSFQWVDFGPIRRYTYAVGAAYQTKYGALGVGARLLNYHNAPSGNGWHLTDSLGVLIPLSYGFSIGASEKSLLDYEFRTEVPPSISTGLLFSMSRFRAGFEASRRLRIPDQDWNYSAGAELLATEYFALRGGYHHDLSRSNVYQSNTYWAAGAGIIGPKAELSANFIRSTKGSPKLLGYGMYFMVKF